MIFRVIVKVGYYERWFEFKSATNATDFAAILLDHEVSSEDHKGVGTEVIMKVIKIQDEPETEEEDE